MVVLVLPNSSKGSGMETQKNSVKMEAKPNNIRGTSKRLRDRCSLAFSLHQRPRSRYLNVPMLSLAFPEWCAEMVGKIPEGVDSLAVSNSL